MDGLVKSVERGVYRSLGEMSKTGYCTDGLLKSVRRRAVWDDAGWRGRMAIEMGRLMDGGAEGAGQGGSEVKGCGVVKGQSQKMSG